MKKLILTILLVVIFSSCNNNEEVKLNTVSKEVVALEISAFLKENSNSNIDFKRNGIVEILGKYFKIDEIEFSSTDPNSRTEECEDTTSIIADGCYWYWHHCSGYSDVCCLNGSGGSDCMVITEIQ